MGGGYNDIAHGSLYSNFYGMGTGIFSPAYLPGAWSPEYTESIASSTGLNKHGSPFFLFLFSHGCLKRLESLHAHTDFREFFAMLGYLYK